MELLHYSRKRLVDVLFKSDGRSYVIEYRRKSNIVSKFEVRAVWLTNKKKLALHTFNHLSSGKNPKLLLEKPEDYECVYYGDI